MSDLEIREAIRRYITGDLDAPTLEDRLEAVAWDMPAAQRLVADALRLLAEHANGDWTDSELRERLGVLTRTYWFEQAPKHTMPGAESVVIRQADRAALAGRLRVTESV